MYISALVRGLYILRILSISIAFALLLVLIMSNSNALVYPNRAFSQTINSNRTQLWIDKENNVKIIFTYEPERLVIGNPTELLFSIQDLRTGNLLKNLFARVIVTDGQKIFKIANATAPNGDFSVNYTFPDSGPYQIISKIDSEDVAALTSFKVIVPPQALSGGFKSFAALMVYYVTPITIIAAGIAIYSLYKKL